MHDSYTNTAEMLRALLEGREQDKNEESGDESPSILRTVRDSHGHSDTVSASLDSGPRQEWGRNDWGYDQW